MKNQAFQPLVSSAAVRNSNSHLSSFLVLDPQEQEVYFESSESAALHHRLCDVVSAKDAIKHLQETGLLPRTKQPQRQVWLQHEPTGHQLGIGVRKKQLVIESSFDETTDAPISYIADVCNLLSEVFISSNNSHENRLAKAV